MQRQKLVIVERLRHDIGRFTGPVFNVCSVASAVYIPCYAVLMLSSKSGSLSPIDVLLLLSGTVLMLMTPAFALAATVEVYFARRIAKASRASRNIELA
jgi:hypothetical protein